MKNEARIYKLMITAMASLIIAIWGIGGLLLAVNAKEKEQPAAEEIEKVVSGESGEINVSFRAGISTGPTQKHLYVLSNDKKHPSVTLTIKATIAKVVDYKPEILNLSLKKGF